MVVRVTEATVDGLVDQLRTTATMTEESTEGLADESRVTRAATEETAEGLPCGEWLRRVDAAARLGISERTLDHRLAAGQLEKRVGPDGRVEICVPRTTADVAVQTTVDLVERLNHAVALQAAPLLEAL